MTSKQLLLDEIKDNFMEKLVTPTELEAIKKFEGRVKLMDDIAADKALKILKDLKQPSFVNFSARLENEKLLDPSKGVRILENQLPVWVLNQRNYLTMNPRKNFEVCHTGVGLSTGCVSSSPNLQSQLDSVDHASDIEKWVVVVGHVIEAAQRIPGFVYDFKYSGKFLTEFLRGTNEVYDIGCKEFNYQQFRDSIKEVESLEGTVISRFSLWTKNEFSGIDKLFAHLVWGDGFVAVKRFDSEKWLSAHFAASSEFLDECVKDVKKYFTTMWERLSYVVAFEAGVILADEALHTTDGSVGERSDSISGSQVIYGSGKLFMGLDDAFEKLDYKKIKSNGKEFKKSTSFL